MNHFLTNICLTALAAAVLLSSCSKPDSIVDQAAEQLVVKAVLKVGEPIQEVQISGLDGAATGTLSGIHTVKVSSDNVNTALSPVPGRPGFYQAPDNILIEEKSTYTLSIQRGDEFITAQSSTPPSMNDLVSSKDHIETTLSDDLVFLEWSGVNTGSFQEYFYMVELIPMDEEAETIRQVTGDYQSSKIISNVPEVTLSVDDFDFFGDHSIKVYAVSKEHEALFAPQADPGLNGPSNILGGHGYFIGASMVEGALEVR